MIPYDEAWVAAMELAIRNTYVMGGRDYSTTRATVWIARIVHDVASGRLTRQQSQWVHLNELRAMLGIPALPAPIWIGEERGSLRVDGLNLLNDHPVHGTIPWFLMGYRMLDVLPLWFANRLVLEDTLIEPMELGFNTIIFSTMIFAPNGHPATLRPQDHADFYQRIALAADVLQSRGLRGWFIAMADAQNVMPLAPDQLQHWDRLTNVLRGGFHMLSVANEGPKNGVPDPSIFPAPAGVPVWSRGSTGGQGPVKPGSVGEYETRREPLYKMFEEALGILYVIDDGDTPTHSPVIHIESIGTAETDVPGRRTSDPRVIGTFAGSAAAGRPFGVAGFAFFSDDAAQGRRLGPRQRACAEAAVQAMRRAS